MRKQIRKRFIIPAVLLAILAVPVGFLSVHAHINKKAMQKTIDSGMEILSAHYKIRELDAGEYTDIRVYGVMKFKVRQYALEGLGNLSVMTTNMGFMQMLSFVITPFEKNMPLLSLDYMYFPGSRKTYNELYDLVKDTKSLEYGKVLDIMRGLYDTAEPLADLPRTEAAWYDDLLTVQLYKTGKSVQEEEIRALFCDAVSRYAQAADTLEPLSDAEQAEKKQITQEYCDNLIRKGGVSTDVFKKALGADTTKDFFDRVFFGTAGY